jgi:hypothetical protein
VLAGAKRGPFADSPIRVSTSRLGEGRGAYIADGSTFRWVWPMAHASPEARAAPTAQAFP